MKLEELMGHEDLRAAIEELLQPATSRPPAAKGPDAIKVTGYVVHGHWRKRSRPVVLRSIKGGRER